MKYTAKHPSNDLAEALELSKEQRERIVVDITKAFNETVPDNLDTISIDDYVGFIAPYIQSQEEAFYAAVVLIGTVQNAVAQYYSKKN